MTYDFSQLNDKEFEILSTDLLSTVFGARIERFKSGKDAGVDGRFFAASGQEVVVQSKHYLKSGYGALIAVAKEEAVKMHKLKPDRYIFVTSLPLSRKNKSEIKKIFSPYLKNDNDVFGQEDLNDILAQHPEIEEKHFKLWIASTNVFARILSNAIKGRSEYELERIARNTAKYVVTDNHGKAIKILDETNVLIISGEPGIGKTTLAENICLHYVANGYMFVDIEENLSEAEQIYKKGDKQIFYFDDFLGSNYFEAIENKKDSHIVKFIDRVKHDKTKKFILTSRTNILNSGMIYSTIFYNKKIEKDEMLLVVQDLSSLEKAYILYNHIWFSQLNIEFVDEIYKDKRYHNIIKHKNFNPRLIEFITDIDRVDVDVNNYWEFVVKTLENPKGIWSTYFKVQSNAFVRNLVILTVFNGGHILEDDLRLGFNELNAMENIKNISHTEKDFTSTAKMAVRSFLNRDRTSSGFSYSLFNPSIADFVLNEFCMNTAKLSDVYKSLDTVESLGVLSSLVKEKRISHPDSLKIFDELLEYGIKKEKNVDYIICAAYLLADNIEKKDQILQFLRRIIVSSVSINEFYKFFALLVKFRDDLYVQDFNFLLSTLENASLKSYDLVILVEFIQAWYVDDQDVLDAVAQKIEDYLTGELNQIIYDNVNVSEHIVYISGYDDEEGTPDLNETSLFRDLEDHLRAKVEEILDNNFYVGNRLDVDYGSVMSAVDTDLVLQEYLESIAESNETNVHQNHGYLNKNIDDDIDDLFERL